MQYEINTKLGFGVLFEKGIDMEGDVKVESEFIFVDPIDNTGFITAIPLKHTKIFRLPSKFSIGYHYRLLDNLMLSSNLTYIFWNSLNNMYENQPDFSASAQLAVTENISTVFGIYITDRNLDYEDYFTIKQDATFYNFGLKAEYENIVLTGELLTTSNSTTEYRKQTIYKLGLDLDLNN